MGRVVDTTFKNPDGGREVVYSPGGSESCLNDGRGGDKIVGEGVIEVALGDC